MRAFAITLGFALVPVYASAQIGNPASMAPDTKMETPGVPAPNQTNYQDRLFAQLASEGGPAWLPRSAPASATKRKRCMPRVDERAVSARRCNPAVNKQGLEANLPKATMRAGQSLQEPIRACLGSGMMFLFDGPQDARLTILLGHGAGAPMDSASMNAAAAALADVGFRVARFEFGYMASRRTEAGRKPPPRAETLKQEYLAAVAALDPKGPWIIGGKSMGGRVASMVADDLHASGKIAGLLCLGYPFHPPTKPEQLRTKHLAELQSPTLIVQGTRDEFGARDEAQAYALSKAIEIFWLEDGDHDLKPRKSVSGFSAADHLKSMAAKVSAWAGNLMR